MSFYKYLQSLSGVNDSERSRRAMAKKTRFDYDCAALRLRSETEIFLVITSILNQPSLQEVPLGD